jgi:hypothetical protein
MSERSVTQGKRKEKSTTLISSEFGDDRWDAMSLSFNRPEKKKRRPEKSGQRFIRTKSCYRARWKSLNILNLSNAMQLTAMATGMLTNAWRRRINTRKVMFSPTLRAEGYCVVRSRRSRA